MNVRIQFNTKKNNENDLMQTQSVSYKDVKGVAEQTGEAFIIELHGNEDEIKETIRVIWELAFLYDGYFYTPIEYSVNDKKEDIKELLFLNYYNTGKMWREAGTSLAHSQRDFCEDRLLNYYSFRNKSRNDGKMIKPLINAFFYFHSEAYERISINHKLSLLLNMCDGFSSNIYGKTNNVKENIQKMFKKTNINVDAVKYGVSILGLPPEEMYYALSQERHEIDHYDLKEKSISEYVSKNPGKKSDYIVLYFCYILELVLRVGFLNQIGYLCKKEAVDYAINDINDWVILSCDISEECMNPHNKLKQELRKQGLNIH